MASRQPLKGVNLGGWLVLEPWITPSLFKDTKAVDEYSFCLHATAAQKRALTRFRDTFITEDDFNWLAQHGVDAVRLPIGYWLFGQQRPYSKTYQYVDMVFEWTERFNILVLLDLHGAPGSQNGQMHSGRRGSMSWLDDDNQAQTIAVLRRIAGRYGKRKALLGISFLNEPSASLSQQALESFYREAEQAVRPLCKPDAWLVFSDAFQPRAWRGRLPNLYLDHHHYQIFAPIDKRLPAWLQLARARLVLPLQLRFWRSQKLIIGEWSLVMGRSQKQPKLYAQRQLRAFKNSDAWFYWNYKTEQGGLWSFRDCVERGIITIKKLDNKKP